MAIMAAALLSASCLKDVDVEVSATVNAMNFDAEGDEVLVYVQTSNTGWTLDSSVIWLTLNRQTATSFTVTCAPNVSPAERQGSIIISALADPLVHHDIKVTQKGADKSEPEPQD